MAEYGYDTGEIAKAFQDQYLRDPQTGKITAVHAHPAALEGLLRELRSFTQRLIENAEDTPGQAFAAWGGQMIPGSSDPSTAKDMAAWLSRLDAYEEAVNNCLVAPGMGELFHCAWEPATKPLLLGWRDDKQTVMDAVTPFSLANRLGVSREFAEESWDQFLTDLKESYPIDAAQKTWKWLLDHSPVKLLADIATHPTSAIVIGLVVAGFAAWLYFGRGR